MSRRPVSPDKVALMKRFYGVENLTYTEISMKVDVPRGTVVAYMHAWDQGYETPYQYNVSKLASRGKDPSEYCKKIRQANESKPENKIFARIVSQAIERSGSFKRDLASRIGCEVETLRLWAKGSAIPRGEKLRVACEVLDVSYADVEKLIREKSDRENVGRLELLNSYG